MRITLVGHLNNVENYSKDIASLETITFRHSFKASRSKNGPVLMISFDKEEFDPLYYRSEAYRRIKQKIPQEIKRLEILNDSEIKEYHVVYPKCEYGDVDESPIFQFILHCLYKGKAQSGKEIVYRFPKSVDSQERNRIIKNNETYLLKPWLNQQNNIKK